MTVMIVLIVTIMIAIVTKVVAINKIMTVTE